MTSLNIGCGADFNGDIRLDVRKDDTTANIIADAQFLPFRSESFHYIFSFDVLEHLEKSPKTVLGEFGRVCTHQGIIHIVTPSSNRYQLLIEVLALPFSLLDRLRNGERLNLVPSVKKILNWKQRMLGDKTTTGYGGHRWLIEWGWKKYYNGFGILAKCWKGIHWKNESIWWKGKKHSSGQFALRMLAKEEVGYN